LSQKPPDTVGQDAKSKNKELTGEDNAPESVQKTPTSKTTKKKVPKIVKIAVIVGTAIVVMVFVWAGAVLLWYVARGWIAFLGLLFSGIATLIAIVGLFGQDFLKRVEESFKNISEPEKLAIFIGVLVATCLILLAFLELFFGNLIRRTTPDGLLSIVH
jgi:hypothetical protein